MRHYHYHWLKRALRRLIPALDQQGALGFTLPTNARGIYVGDDRLDKVLAKLDERHAVVALHPNEPKPNIEAMSDVVPAPLMEFIFDTTRTVIYMSQNNVFSNIQILSGLFHIVVHYFLSLLNVLQWVIKCLEVSVNLTT